MIHIAAVTRLISHAMMQAIMKRMALYPDRTFFYFYFGAATQPRSLRLGRSATVCQV
jgi:hypothetical protein